MKHYLFRFTAFLFPLLFTCLGQAEPIYPVYRPQTGGIHPLKIGTTHQMHIDWAQKELRPESAPDRSYLNIWVRMFPTLANPLNDPYPDTQDKNHLTISNPSGFKVFALDDAQLLITGHELAFDFEAGRVTVDGRAFTLEGVWILPQASDLTLAEWDKGGKLPSGKAAEVRVKLRGGFVVMPTLHKVKDSPDPIELWSLINVVNVNDYLRSVVPSEVIASWHAETLKVQAIAARTYGLYEVAEARARNKEFDVDPTTWYQSYQGAEFWLRESRTWKTVELSSTSAAVAATGSSIITYNGDIIKAYFSSNSGGKTCTFTECFEGGANPPYLVSVSDASGVRNSPGGTWGKNAKITSSTIKAQLAAVGISPSSPPSRLTHLERGPSKRTWRLRVILKNGKGINLDRTQTRKMMATFGAIRSFSYELGSVAKSGRQRITGHGYGHGVGMSQWGAQLYAKAGWSATRILTHFYTGTKIEDLGTQAP